MRLIMAVSQDGYVARGPRDDMKWTPGVDKRLFKLLTSVGFAPLAAGRKTAELMPSLNGRPVIGISRNPQMGSGHVTLEEFYAFNPNAWLIGGQDLARSAIKKNYVDQVFLCRNQIYLGRPEEGIKLHTDLSDYGERVNMIDFEWVKVEVRR